MTAPSGRNFLDDLLSGVVALACIAVISFVFALVDKPFFRLALVLIYLIPAGPAILFSSVSFFGMWMFIIAVTLLFKFDLFPRGRILSFIVCISYFSPWVAVAVFSEPSGAGNYFRVLAYVLFLIAGLFTLYFIFEEQIRDLLASNKTKESALAEKDTALAVQAAEIARLEPLSEMGERVAHVAHSFKNNLSLIGTVIFFLEQLHDEKRAVEKLQEFSKTVNDRIDNILMISRAGVDLEPEDFDVARLLEGLKQVYLNERTFSNHARTELTVSGPWVIRAVRWDFILMVENILKNALEAIVESSISGTIRVDLAGPKLTIANDGGPLALCDNCGDSCLNCPRYGHPGRTTKPGGTGYGLAQVFGTCRKNGWGLRLRTSGQWTIFEITLG